MSTQKTKVIRKNEIFGEIIDDYASLSKNQLIEAIGNNKLAPDIVVVRRPDGSYELSYRYFDSNKEFEVIETATGEWWWSDGWADAERGPFTTENEACTDAIAFIKVRKRAGRRAAA